MTLVELRCPGCQAPIRFAPGARTADCAFCGAQVRDLDAGAPAPVPASAPPSAGPRLAETLALRVGDRAIPLVPAGTALPTTFDQRLSTSRDDQDALPLTLVAQRAGLVDRALAELAFPIVQRAPRGVPKLHLRITIAVTGAATLALWEDGADNRQLVDLGSLAVG